MTIRLVQRRGTESYTHLLENVVPSLLNVRKVPLDDYYSGQDICEYFDTTPDELMSFINNSSNIHAVLVDTGAFFIHPDGVRRLLRKWAKDLICSDIAVNPITRKEFLFD